MADDITSLPVQAAIRLTLDSVSYSNPLPEWFEPLGIHYGAREQAIRQKMRGYAGGAQPRPPFEIWLPTKSRRKKRWIVPSVNDQIACQACVSSIAQQLFAKSVDPNRVFSYRYNAGSQRLALIEDQVSAWKEFQIETERRCRDQQCILQIDLQNTFQSIDRGGFFRFLRRVLPGGVEIELLRNLLESFGAGQPGLPLVNDTVFFLGNAYLSEVDRVVARHASDFIRFVDDYRIFDASRGKLEAILEKISQEVRGLGFQVNPQKVRLGAGQEYLEAISKVKYAQTERDRGYVSAVILADVLGPEDMVALVAQAVERPEQLLTEGFGRHLLAAWRRMRLNAVMAHRKNYPNSPLDAYSAKLGKETSLVEKIRRMITTYSRDRRELWRSVWLLYLAQDISFQPGVKETMDKIRQSQAVPVLARLWARTSELLMFLRPERIEELHELGYVEAGKSLYGS